MIVSMQRRALQDFYECVKGNVEGNSPECMVLSISHTPHLV